MIWLAVEAVTVGGFDPANALLNFGLLGVFFLILLGGRIFVLTREKTDLNTAWEKRWEDRDKEQARLDGVKDDRIEKLEGTEKELRTKVEEQNAFIREALVEHQEEILSKTVELLQIKLGGGAGGG